MAGGTILPTFSFLDPIPDGMIVDLIMTNVRKGNEKAKESLKNEKVRETYGKTTKRTRT